MLISRIEDGENLKNAFEISGQPLSSFYYKTFQLSSFIESHLISASLHSWPVSNMGFHRQFAPDDLIFTLGRNTGSPGIFAKTLRFRDCFCINSLIIRTQKIHSLQDMLKSIK